MKLGQTNTLRSGPWKNVYNTTDPGDRNSTDTLVDARNVYIPDPDNGSGTYARPGFTLLNAGARISTAGKGQGVYTHTATDGTTYNLCVFGGHLYRTDATLSIFTDVTPSGVAIDSASRVYFASMGGVMCVSDGVHAPWVGSSLSSTPIVGTYIDFDGSGTTWAAFGPPVVFGGSGFFILSQYNGVSARLDIAWSEPNDWTLGYQQANYDNRWTLEQTGTAPLTGLAPTNVALYYWRQRSIGSINGTVGPDLATTATHDAISTNVGTAAPQTIVQFGDFIYFCDVIGRPYRFPVGGALQPIWHQLRAIIDASEVAYPAITATVATGAFEPTINQYCVAIWTSAAGSQSSPIVFQSFDAQTGNYAGQWSVGPADPGISVDCLGSFVDTYGRGTFIVLGSATAGGVTGYAWGMNSLVGVPDFLGTEDLVILTEEDGTTELTIEGQPAVWKDNGDVPLIFAQTDRLGYSADVTWQFDQAQILAGTASPVTVTLTTPVAANVLEGTPTPPTSADGISRLVCSLDAYGRGAMVAVSPTTAESQWSIQSVTVTGVPSPAGIDDP